MPVGDQSLAVVLPRSNYLSQFQNSYYRAKQYAAQKDARAAALVKAKQDADDKNLQDITLITSPEQQVQAALGNNYAQTYQQVRQAQKEGKSPAEQQMIVAQGNIRGQNIKSYGETYKTAAKEDQDYYTGLGLNGAAVDGILRQEYMKPENIGTADLSPARRRAVIEQRGDELLIGNKATDAAFKNIGIRQENTKRNANGIRTASGKTLSIPNDADIEDVNGKEVVVPKSENFIADNVNTQAEIKKGGNNMHRALAQASLTQLQNSKNGSINLYDKDAYDVQIQKEDVRREVKREFNAHVKTFESEHPGEVFPRGGEIEETAKRAILYKKRALSIDSKMGETIGGPQFKLPAININNGSSKSGSGPVAIDERYARTKALANEEQPAKTVFGLKIGGGYKPVPTSQMNDEDSRYYNKLAKDALTPEQAKYVGPGNVYVHQKADGKMILYATVPEHENSAGNVVSSETVQIATLNEQTVDTKAQTSQKERRAVISRGSQAAPPAPKPATTKKAKDPLGIL